jgi:transcriptional regulator with XRE-family HTH domain
MKEFNDLRKELKENDIVSYTILELVGKLMAYRNQQKISQRELSEKTGVAQKTISRIENGVDLPSIETIIRLADGIGYELSLVKKQEKFK